MPHTDFRLEVLVDFLDDALTAAVPWSGREVDALMRRLAEAGVRRVSWAYYGDGHGGLLLPAGLIDGGLDWMVCQETYRQLGNPLREAVSAGHRYGMEVYAYYKPYETGVAMVMPAGSPEARTRGLLRHGGGQLGVLDPFVHTHPGLRIQRRTDDLPAGQPPICALALTKADAAPTRVTADHLQLWTSPDNYQYQPLHIPFQVSEQVEVTAADVFDHAGTLVTRRGDPVRVLILSGFRLDDPYVLVTTDFQEGPADFAHAGTALLTAYDAAGQVIPGLTATGAGVWLASRVDFRQWGLQFDYGWGRAVTQLDAPNASGRAGIIAFTPGKNAYLPAALCESEPAVQAYWLRCLGEMVAAGVDGVDFREENHCTHTDEPEAYGFNPVVLAQCRPGVEVRAEVARVRGEAYTAFLRQAHALLAGAGIPLRYHLNMDHFRPDPPPSRALAYPANLHFDWTRWLEEGLLDEAVLRSYHHRQALLTDAFGQEITTRCCAHGVPISHNHHIFDNDPWYAEEARRVAADGRFAGIILYETDSFLHAENGACTFTLESAVEICRTLRG